MFARHLYGSGDDGVKFALHVVEHAVMEYELLMDEFDVGGNNSFDLPKMRACRQAR